MQLRSQLFQVYPPRFLAGNLGKLPCLVADQKRVCFVSSTNVAERCESVLSEREDRNLSRFWKFSLRDEQGLQISAIYFQKPEE